MSGKRRKFAREFKLDAVRLAARGDESLAQTARNLGIRPELLRRWREELAGAGKPGGAVASEAELEELKKLRRENQRLSEERDILKKAVAIFSVNRER